MRSKIKIRSKVVDEVLEGLAESTQVNYKCALRQFKTFLESKEGVSGEVFIDDVVKEAKSDVTKTQKQMDDFYRWLQNEKVEGYELRGKAMRQSSAYSRVYSTLRGFFVNLDIYFERKWKKNVPRMENAKEALKKDKIYTFYDVDEKSRTIRFNRERMQQFLSNLKLRDQAITLSLLSSSQDTGDFFKLNVGHIREQTGHRIFWEGTRNKSGVLFRTFFSKEATRLIRRYIQQERRDADDQDPLFVYTRYKSGEPVDKRMSPYNLSAIYRDAAKRMGIKWSKEERNPLRPKRMRKLFRTACDTAGIPELHINAFMGHKNNQGQDYSELSKAKLELEYLRVEPFLTVYGEVEESLEIKEDVARLEKRIVDLNKDISALGEMFEKKVLEIKAEFDQRLAEFFEEYGSQMSDTQPEVERPEVSKEEILRAKRKLRKT